MIGGRQHEPQHVSSSFSFLLAGLLGAFFPRRRGRSARAPDFLHEHSTVLGLVQTGKGRTLDCGPLDDWFLKRAYYCLPCSRTCVLPRPLPMFRGRGGGFEVALHCCAWLLFLTALSGVSVSMPIRAILTIDCMFCALLYPLRSIRAIFHVCSLCRCQGRWLRNRESALPHCFGY